MITSFGNDFFGVKNKFAKIKKSQYDNFIRKLLVLVLIQFSNISHIFKYYRNAHN